MGLHDREVCRSLWVPCRAELLQDCRRRSAKIMAMPIRCAAGFVQGFLGAIPVAKSAAIRGWEDEIIWVAFDKTGEGAKECDRVFRERNCDLPTLGRAV